MVMLNLLLNDFHIADLDPEEIAFHPMIGPDLFNLIGAKFFQIMHYFFCCHLKMDLRLLQFNIQFTPNLSCNIPKISPQNCFATGITTLPPSLNLLKISLV